MSNDTTDDKKSRYNYINEIIQKKEGETGEEPTTGFKVGYAVGFILTTVGGIALEAVLVGFAATVLGFSLTFWQCLVIALTFEYVLTRRSI